MLISELLEAKARVEDLLPPKVRSQLLGKAARLALDDVMDVVGIPADLHLSDYDGFVALAFEFHAGSHIGVASMLKRRLKEVGLSPYSSQQKEDYGDIHRYAALFRDFAWEDYNANAFKIGFGASVERLSIDAGKGVKIEAA